jgi:hypothetical protein
VVLGLRPYCRRQSAKKWPYVIALRKQLLDDGTLVQKDGFYRFRDVEFFRILARPAVIEGSANGLVSGELRWTSSQETDGWPSPNRSAGFPGAAFGVLQETRQLSALSCQPATDNELRLNQFPADILQDAPVLVLINLNQVSFATSPGSSGLPFSDGSRA